MLRLWQELHEMNPDRDRRGSKNSFFPNSTIAGLVTVCGSIFWIGSSLEAAIETSATRNRLAAVIRKRVGMMDLAAATQWSATFRQLRTGYRRKPVASRTTTVSVSGLGAID
jgi:hypothetical protein